MSETVFQSRGVTFRIYPRTDLPETAWRVSYYVGAVRKRPTVRGDRKAAEAFCRSEALSISSGAAIDGLHLTPLDKRVFVTAKQTLASEGLGPLTPALDAAAREFVEARRILKGRVSLADAARLWAKTHGENLEVRTLPEVTEELIAQTKRKKKSKDWSDALKDRLKELKKSLAIPIADVTTSDLESLLGKLEKTLAPRTINNRIKAYRRLFNFAKTKCYLPKTESTAADALEEMADPAKGGAVSVFSPAQLAALLENAPTKLLPCIAIGAFTGLRNAEICRLTWNEVLWDEKVIVVEKAQAKQHRGASRRTVPISPNLAAWLHPWRAAEGKICDYGSPTTLCRAQSQLAESVRWRPAGGEWRTGFKWPQNGLRHSRITYRLAETQNAALVALESGNSEAEIHSAYNAVGKPSVAKAWWHIFPVELDNVLELAG